MRLVNRNKSWSSVPQLLGNWIRELLLGDINLYLYCLTFSGICCKGNDDVISCWRLLSFIWLLLLLSCTFVGREIDFDFFRDIDGLSNDVVELVWLLWFEVFSKRKLLKERGVLSPFNFLVDINPR